MTQRFSDTDFDTEDLGWVQTLIELLRHPAPAVADQARDSLLVYIQAVASRRMPVAMPLPSLPRLHG